MNYLIGQAVAFVAGACCASVAWYFVWRNNKAKFEEKLRKLK